MKKTPRDIYEEKIQDGVIKRDPAQQEALNALDTLFREIFDKEGELDKGPRKKLNCDKESGYSGRCLSLYIFRSLWPFGQSSHQNKTGRRTLRPKGVYLYGDVGRGKSMLVDIFAKACPEPSILRHVHFHDFLREVHEYIFRHPNEGLEGMVCHTAARTRLLCFDEFHVGDVADAMILQRLFTALISRGVIVIATSNYPPDRLYEDGLQRQRFLPFIDLIKEQMNVIALNGPVDYRAAVEKTNLSAESATGTYFHPLDQRSEKQAGQLLTKLSHGAKPQPCMIELRSRRLEIEKVADHIGLCNFAALCERPAGYEDYKALAHGFDIIFIFNIPRLGYDRRNETRRFMTLIDILYESQRGLIVTADEPIENLYQGHEYEFEFRRTASRLLEMTSPRYFSRVSRKDGSADGGRTVPKQNKLKAEHLK